MSESINESEPNTITEYAALFDELAYVKQLLAAERHKRNELCAEYEREEMEYKKLLATLIAALDVTTGALNAERERT